jgi:ATP-dependent DNA helicase PIF1
MPKVKKKKSEIKITKEFKDAFAMMDGTKAHVFLTGEAGTGKSTLLKYFREHTNKKHVVLAPTGIAALNVKGQTIHSFFGFHPQIRKDLVHHSSMEKKMLFKSLDTIVIDEISMVRADLLDCVDQALRLNRDRPSEPFGGVQMILVGDLFQLPPVVTRDEEMRFKTEYATPYFFSASVMDQVRLETVVLKKVHRQKEQSFVELLNRLRNKKFTPEDIDTWNERHDSSFDPTDEPGYVHLTTTNKMAKQRNDYELDRLDGKAWSLKATSSGSVPSTRMPSESVVGVKAGAQIMFTTNDPGKRWVNGTLGTVIYVRKKGLSKHPVLDVELENGKEVEVDRHTWEMFEYSHGGGDGGPKEEPIGSYTQYPIVLAWAVTIHKAQGKTFDRVLVDIGWGAFAHGQMYVALSRCTTQNGIVLAKPFNPKDVILDDAVLEFMERADW